jgi:hypothetical protein
MKYWWMFVIGGLILFSLFLTGVIRIPGANRSPTNLPQYTFQQHPMLGPTRGTISLPQQVDLPQYSFSLGLGISRGSTKQTHFLRPFQ